MGTSNQLTKSIIFIIAIFAVSINLIAQTGWVIQNSGTTGGLTFIYFIDANTGFAGNPTIKTTNGGIQWSQFPSTMGFYDMDFINSNTGFIAAGGIYKTTDGGYNWLNIGCSLKTHIEFINENTGYAVGSPADFMFNSVKKTTNSGVTWDSSLISGGPMYSQNFYSSLDMYNDQIGYVTVCQDEFDLYPYGKVYKTPNGAINWLVSLSRDYVWFYTVCVPAQDTVFCTCYDSYSTPEQWYIYKAVNDIWAIQDTSTIQLNDLCFPNALTGYAVGNNGLILKTTNGGINWNTQNSGTALNLEKAYFVNSMTGYIVGSNGLILKTTTGGEPPHTVSGTVRYQDNNQPVSSGYVKALQYDEQTQNIITVDSANINSNGTYMLPHCPPIQLDIMAFQDDEEDNYFVPTYYVSTIYWENATHVTPDTNLTGIDIGVYRINNTAGSMHIGGTVYRSDNVDLSVLKNAIVYSRIGNVFKGYSITGYQGSYRIDSLASGTYEIIANRMGFYSAVRPLQLTNYSMDTIDFVMSILLVSVEPNGNNIPEKYWLSQNYPNPFNPQTKIKFGLPVQTYVKLSVYDVLGRKVGMLVNEELKAGEYNVTWDASSLSSGIYFYRLEAERFIETRKMVLVK